MPDSEEETYSIMFKSLKHPARRKILRMLAEKPKNFSRILDEMGISSSHLTYHLENLGELVTKMESGKYRLSTFGQAAVLTMKGVEETPEIRPSYAMFSSNKFRIILAFFVIAIILLASFSYIQYVSLESLSNNYDQLSNDYEGLSVEYDRLLSSVTITTEGVIQFLEEVIQLDMTKYSATLERNTIDYQSILGGITEEGLTYRLSTNRTELIKSELVIDFRFRNQSLSRYRLDVIEGMPIHSKAQSNDILSKARDILQRYKDYAGGSYIEPIIRSLETIDEIENMEKIIGNIKLFIITDGNDVEFQWIHTTDGIEYQSKKVSLNFDRNILEIFTDDWFLFRVGSTEINISEEEAITIALEKVKDFSWNAPQNGRWTEVTDFVLIEEPRSVTLLPHSREEPLELIPYWYITFYLDKVYPGNVNSIAVGIWADTGEVQNLQTLIVE